MKSKNIGLRISGTIFGMVGVIHLLRLVTGVPVLIDNFSLPMWVNVIGFIVTFILCTWLWRVSFKTES